MNQESLNVINLQSIHAENQKRACILVQNCLNYEVIDELRNYFQISLHNYGTRNKQKFLGNYHCSKHSKLAKTFCFYGS